MMLSDADLRLECLKLAGSYGGVAARISAARQLEAFVRGTPAPPSNDQQESGAERQADA